MTEYIYIFGVKCPFKDQQLNPAELFP